MATETASLWIDYPTIGHSKNWIAVHEDTSGYESGNIGYILFRVNKIRTFR